MVSAEEQFQVLSRGAAEIISPEDLMARLRTGRPLRVKLGLDPTAPHIHLGFAVVLRKLRQFQDFGHQVVLLIGDFTARVGDPTGRSETRKVLTPEEIQANAQTYKEQFSLILDPERTEVRFNSEWLEPMRFADVVHLCSHYTVARILERDDFAQRYRSGIPIHMHEILYPLMQGYDSVALRADVEMGGTDQKFNNLVGRELQRAWGQPPQVVFLMPILEGLDGVQKMSKSLGNYVGITEPPLEMFGKLMSLPDRLVERYFELCTDVPMDEVRRRLATEHPMECKKWLAREIITIYHGAQAARAAQAEWERVFSQRQYPSEMPEVEIPAAELQEGGIDLVRLLPRLGLAGSGREAMRLITQGGVEIDGVRCTERRALSLRDGSVVHVGRRFVRLRLV
ncbi:MAG TPA: tyrosine--tRNA ligase [Candidatus Nitrosotenuis sp.]|nr:tyrosine--tRNA ligase [Candidatus Nitrosotenuis sp.]